VLASGGLRAVEALAIRQCDIDFNGINFADINDKSNPVSIKIRKEYTKTRTARTIFISNEAARYLHYWIEWKYRKRKQYYILKRDRTNNNASNNKENDLVFSKISSTDPHRLYFNMIEEFQKILEAAGLASRKEDGVYKRRKITFHSFRRFVKTTIANQTRNSDYSEWFLGHKKSPYYTNKPEELKRIYKEDCMKYLTFLDYPTVEATGRSFEAQIKQKDVEIEGLKHSILTLEQQLSKQVDKSEIDRLREQVEQYKEQVEQFNHFKAQISQVIEKRNEDAHLETQKLTHELAHLKRMYMMQIKDKDK
jgi:Phage integrase family